MGSSTALNEILPSNQVISMKGPTFADEAYKRFSFCVYYRKYGLTSLNDLSRNRTLGLMIGKGFLTNYQNQSSVVLKGVRAIKSELLDYIF